VTCSPENERFLLKWNGGGITSLRASDDTYDTEYIQPDQTLGDVVVHYRMGEGAWREARAFASGDVRAEAEDASAGTRAFSYMGDSDGAKGIRDFGLTESFILEEIGLTWTLSFTNRSMADLELGDVALPLPFNKDFAPGNTTNYTQRVARHGFISGHGSFHFWMRPNGVGPYLVMTPLEGTKLEYYELKDTRNRVLRVPYWVYIHSAVDGAGETRGTWRQPHTSVILAPGETVRYGFRFRWAEDYDGVRQVLFEEGLFDVRVVPGMTVPQDTEALVSLRTRHAVHTIVAEYPGATQARYLGEAAPGTHIYRVKFRRLGENLLTVRFAGDRYMTLEFFVTEPLDVLVKKRAAFLVDHQQHRDPAKWYNGLISVWDMREAVLRGPEDTDGFDGWWGYVLACDDTALPKAPFVAAKNVHYPVQAEIAAIEYYIEQFVWGKLQRTDQEDPCPYFIYGVPNWFENRHSEHGFGSGGKGLEHIWRGYDYPHIFMLYLNMYRIAKAYPHLTRYLDADGYLERAYGTAKAHFDLAGYGDLPQGARGYWAYTLGLYNERLIVDLIDVLEAEGQQGRADWLRGEWEKKVKYFTYDDPYPFDSEYAFDTTAFETSHAVAKYGLAHEMQPDEDLWYDKHKDVWYSHPEVKRSDFADFMDRQVQANIALRGWVEPAYYLLGSDYRGADSTRYQLSYMSQLGGWAVLDYALFYAEDPYPYLQLGYASQLSSWALMNTGTPESDYGYWYPGEENDGASGWAVIPEKYGPMWIRKSQGRGAWFYDGEIELGYGSALRSAATIVADDPLFGLIAYGGNLEETDDGFVVTPRDELRKRFHVVDRERRIHLELSRDGFRAGALICVSADRSRWDFELENRTSDAHTTVLRVAGLECASYRISVDGSPVAALSVPDDGWHTAELKVPSQDCAVLIEKEQ